MPGSPPRPPFSFLTLTVYSLYGEDMFDIYVGPDEVHFRVHKRVLCDRVPCFKMFGGDFEEGVENVARFPVDDPDRLDLLLQCSSTGNIERTRWGGYYNMGPSQILQISGKVLFADRSGLHNGYCYQASQEDADVSFSAIHRRHIGNDVGQLPPSAVRALIVTIH
jgi:hypothetical protein